MPFYRFHTHEVFYLQSKNTDMKQNSGMRNKELVDIKKRLGESRRLEFHA